MNKKFICAAFATLTLVGMTACSENDSPDVPSIPATTFTDATGLTLNVNGAPMIGKTVSFTPDANNSSKGTLTLYSSLNLSDLATKASATEIAGPGVIPGSPKVEIPVSLKEKDGKVTFDGKGDSEYCTYSYSGTVSGSDLNLSISDLKLKDASLAGSYTPVTYETVSDPDAENYGDVKSNPIYVNWVSTSNFDFLGQQMPISDIVKLLMIMPIIDDMTKTVPQMLNIALKDFTLGNDGSVNASYLDIENEGAVPSYLTSPANLAQYVVAAPGTMRLFLNAQAIKADATKAEGDIDIDNIFGNIVAQLAPYYSLGLPLNFRTENGQTVFYIPTEVILPLLKTNVVPLLRNEMLIEKLQQLIQDTDMSMLAPMIPAMVKSAADVIDNTTTLEIGINTVRK